MSSSAIELKKLSSSVSTKLDDSLEVATRLPLPPSISTVYLDRTRTITTISDPYNETRSQNIVTLPPTDGGFGAWTFLAAAFCVETIVWGFPSAFGVFLNAYLRDARDHILRRAVVYPIIYRYPRLMAASYTTQVTNLVAYQGVLYSLGGGPYYHSTRHPLSSLQYSSIIREHPILPNAVGGLLLPLLLPSLIEKRGSSVALRITAIVFAAFLPALLFLKRRLPEPSFILLVIVNTLQGFGYFVPILWLPTFASELKLSATNASLALAVLNGSSVIGRLGTGVLSDAIDPWLLALSTLFGSCLTTFVLWGALSYTLGGLISFGLFYGLVAGGWSSLWTGFIRPISPEDPKVATKMIGYLMLSRGLGNILSTPISAALASRRLEHSSAFSHGRLGFDVGDGPFEKVIIYAGTCFAGATIMAGSGWFIEKTRGNKKSERLH
ncbi:hypothetical protein PIIN_07439 [Serendipita indica DSM 11827]|uniref:MFS general substrate transporter n=1 Tax=Serendipita indica (strain DSM 11827) TaxID=1109443 RepID=G4TQ93_SERID|nr:hypothetical protein PIIN_07439 [Serendipita indica DSM 11827]